MLVEDSKIIEKCPIDNIKVRRISYIFLAVQWQVSWEMNEPLFRFFRKIKIILTQ